MIALSYSQLGAAYRVNQIKSNTFNALASKPSTDSRITADAHYFSQNKNKIQRSRCYLRAPVGLCESNYFSS